MSNHFLPKSAHFELVSNHFLPKSVHFEPVSRHFCSESRHRNRRFAGKIPPMDEVVIRPTTGHVGLRLFAPERRGGTPVPDYFLVEAGDSQASARLRVYVYEPANLASFFAGMAREWRGWSGEKTWESIEGELGLRAVADGKGHVTLSVRLQAQPWRFEGRALLEAGRLERLAAEIAEFIGEAG